MILLTLAVFSYSGYFVYDNVYNSEKNITIRRAKEAREKETQAEKAKQTHIIDDDPDWSSFYK